MKTLKQMIAVDYQKHIDYTQFVHVKEHLKMQLWVISLKNVFGQAKYGLKKAVSILPLPVMCIHIIHQR